MIFMVVTHLKTESVIKWSKGSIQSEYGLEPSFGSRMTVPVLVLRDRTARTASWVMPRIRKEEIARQMLPVLSQDTILFTDAFRGLKPVTKSAVCSRVRAVIGGAWSPETPRVTARSALITVHRHQVGGRCHGHTLPRCAK